MATSSQRKFSPRVLVERNGSTLACGLFVVIVGLGAVAERRSELAVYLLSFWHYYLYWLAFAFGAVRFAVFKRDAVAMKIVSVAILATAYFAVPLDFVSLAVVAGGALLNIRAATVLGFERTYYGHEVAGLPPLRVTAFPYSLIAHPMIAGNIAAFGGTLLNPEFARQWWPLACTHVALNIGLLAMELADVPRARLVRFGSFVFAGVLFAAAFVLPGLVSQTPISMSSVAWLQIAAAVACAGVLFRSYARVSEPEGISRRA